MSDTCSICVDTFNNSLRRKVTCQKCNIDICTKCIKKFLAENVQEPNCMNCKEVYTKSFMDANFSYTYRRSVLKNVRLNVLVAREKQIMPELMHRADAYKKLKESEVKRRGIRQRIDELEVKLEQVYSSKAKLDELLNNNIVNIDTVDEKITDEFMKSITDSIINTNKVQRKLESELDELEMCYDENWEDIIKFNNTYRYGGIQKVASVMNCLRTNCKGFLDNEYKCGICHIKVCKDCHEELIEDESHTCKQENVDSIKAIQTETRPCPTCKSRVFKSEGCDQMFCVQCHTGFSWNTGMIERGRIHNPHYFEWLRSKRREMPREIGDVPCGGLPSWLMLKRHLNEVDAHFTITSYLSSVYKMTEYIQDKEIPKYPVTEGRDEDLNIIAIDYMADVISLNQWRNRLFQIEKKKEINRERRLILDMVLAVLIDLFGDIYSLKDKDVIAEKVNEFDELRKYFNVSIKNLGDRFDMYNFKIIDETWQSWTY